MESFLTPPDKVRLLVVRDVDIDSVSRLGEHLVVENPRFDGVLLCGPIIQQHVQTAEELAVAHGDAAITLGQLENIVCRVLYVPCESDPLPFLKDQLYLTANSVNLHGRHVMLTKDLYAVGVAEISDQTVADSSAEEDEGVKVSSNICAAILQEMLGAVEKRHTGMIVLNYHYAHTLNNLLFHMTSELEAAGVGVMVISSSGPGEETSRLPKRIGKYSIVAPKSLRAGYYTELWLERGQSSVSWSVTRNETLQLPPAEL